jgi:hypothetical protein
MKRGRPRLEPGTPSTQVTVYLSVKTFDALCREARAADVSVPEVIRRKIREAPIHTLKNR